MLLLLLLLLLLTLWPYRHATDTQQFLLEGDDHTRALVFAELNAVGRQHKLAFKNVFAGDGQAADVNAQVI